MRLLSYNIRFGGSRRREQIAGVIEALAPDVVVLQEATEPEVVDWIARRAGLETAIRQPGWSVAALTREPPAVSTWHRPRPHRGFLEIDDPTWPVRVIGVHLTAGMTARGERTRLREAAQLGPLVTGAPRPSVAVGDFNAIAPGDHVVVARWPLWIRLLLRVDGGIRTDALRFLERAGLTDSFRRLHPDDAGYTLPARDPSVRLDYLMSTAASLPLVRSCAPVTAADVPLVTVASDHLPLLTVLDANDGGEPRPS